RASSSSTGCVSRRSAPGSCGWRGADTLYEGHKLVDCLSHKYIPARVIDPFRMPFMRPSLLAAPFALALAAVPFAGVPAQEMIDYSWNGYEARIPAEPQRVIVMDSRTGPEFAILAGYPIVATDFDADSHMVLDPETEKLEFRAEPNVELVLSYDPDLLVVGRGWWNFWQDNQAFRADNFNVLVIEDANNADWKDLMVGQLEAIGRADRAAEA